MHFLKTYQVPILIFLVALGVRAFFLPFPPFDSQSLQLPGVVALDGYYELAESLQAGDGFTRLTEGPYAGPDSVRTPLYPFLIVALVSVFGSYHSLFLLQALLGAATAVIAWLIAKEFLSQRSSIVVGVLVAVEPLTAYLTGIMLTETVFNFIFLLALWLLLRFLSDRRVALLAGASLLLGISMLVKPTVQYLPMLILFVLAYAHHFNLTKGFVRDAAVVMVIFILSIAPWAFRNYMTFGTSALVVQPVSNLFTYLVPSTIAFETGQTYEEAVADFFAREGVTSIEEINLSNMDYYKERAVAELVQHPKGLAISLGMTFFTFFTHDTYAMILERYDVAISYAHPPLTTLVTNPGEALRFAWQLLSGPEAFVLLGRLFWILTALLFFAGIILHALRKPLSPALLLAIGTVAYFAVTTSVIGLAINGRFRVPVNPLIFIFAVYALEAMFQKRPDRDKTVRGPYLLPVGR